LYQNVKFTYPITLTLVHMICCFIGSFLVLHVFRFIPFQTFESQRQMLFRVVPLSAIFCSNIVLGNISLRWVPISFMQTVKSSVPAFAVFLQAILFKDYQNLSSDKLLSLIPIVGGVGLASTTEINFDLLGFSTALVASVMTALQAMMTGRLLTQKLDSVNLVYYMAPTSILFLLPISLYFESSLIVTQWEFYGDNSSLLILFVSGMIAFFLNVTSFLVIANTSPLTFTVAGNLKVVASIIISVMIFRNEITIWNGVGCATALLGVLWYQKICLDQSQAAKELPFQAPRQT